jgi:hypothetical protein
MKWPILFRRPLFEARIYLYRVEGKCGRESLRSVEERMSLTRNTINTHHRGFFGPDG